MDFVSKRHLISQALSPLQGFPHMAMQTSSSNFPIAAILIIGLVIITFLLLSYYIFVIKCCLNLQGSGLVRRFSLRRNQRFTSYWREPECRGLEEAMIRSIPLIHYNKGDESLSGCSVCLNEFQQDEKLKAIPNCSHAFHIECIDVWLQNNDNCPLCRTKISLFFSQINAAGEINAGPITSSQDQIPHVENENQVVSSYDEDVVINLENEDDSRKRNSEAGEEIRSSISEQRIIHDRKKLQKVSSMRNECVLGIRAERDEQFLVHHISRSFSMDSSGNRKVFLEAEQDLKHQNEVSSIEVVCGSGGGKRSLFSLGHGSSRSRNAVLPVYFDP